jgi:hypothetical protein
MGVKSKVGVDIAKGSGLLATAATALTGAAVAAEAALGKACTGA